MILDAHVLHQSNNTTKKKRDDEDMYCIVGAVKDKYSPSFIPEKFIRMWSIGLNTVINTLYASTHQCIIPTGLLEKWFKMKKHNHDKNKFLVGTVHYMLII